MAQAPTGTRRSPSRRSTRRTGTLGADPRVLGPVRHQRRGRDPRRPRRSGPRPDPRGRGRRAARRAHRPAPGPREPARSRSRRSGRRRRRRARACRHGRGPRWPWPRAGPRPPARRLQVRCSGRRGPPSGPARRPRHRCGSWPREPRSSSARGPGEPRPAGPVPGEPEAPRTRSRRRGRMERGARFVCFGGASSVDLADGVGRLGVHGDAMRGGPQGVEPAGQPSARGGTTHEDAHVARRWVK